MPLYGDYYGGYGYGAGGPSYGSPYSSGSSGSSGPSGGFSKMLSSVLNYNLDMGGRGGVISITNSPYYLEPSGPSARPWASPISSR